MDDTNPLWRIMDNASWARMKQGPYAPQDIRAAEIRAIAQTIRKIRKEIIDEMAANGYSRPTYDLESKDIVHWLEREAALAEGKING